MIAQWKLYCCNRSVLDVIRKFTTSVENSIQNDRRINRIKLIGRITGGTAELSDNLTSFLVKTTEANQQNETLKNVLHSLRAINKKSVGNLADLTENDLVQVDGQIVYNTFLTRNGESITKTHIFAQRIMPFESHIGKSTSASLVKESINEVKLIGLIGTEIKNSSSTICSVVTHDDARTNLNKNYSSDWHRIRIIDENLRTYVTNNIGRTDRVLIRGKMSYRKFDSSDGQVFYHGEVIANKIQKLSELE